MREDREAVRRRGLNEAMKRYVQGDDRVFPSIYCAVAPRIQAFDARALRDRMLAEDIVQQTLLNVFRARHAFVPGADVLPWVYTIARRLIVDAMRRRRSERRLPRARLPRAEGPPARPDEELAGKQAATFLSLALTMLPDSQRRVLELREGGMSIAGVAALLGTTVVAVKLKLHRVYQSLRRAVPGGGDEWTRSKRGRSVLPETEEVGLGAGRAIHGR